MAGKKKQSDSGKGHAQEERKEDKLLDVKQAASRLSISPRSVYRLIDRKELRAGQFAPIHGTRIYESEIERYKAAVERGEKGGVQKEERKNFFGGCVNVANFDKERLTVLKPSGHHDRG